MVETKDNNSIDFEMINLTIYHLTSDGLLENAQKQTTSKKIGLGLCMTVLSKTGNNFTLSMQNMRKLIIESQDMETYLSSA